MCISCHPIWHVSCSAGISVKDGNWKLFDWLAGLTALIFWPAICIGAVLPLIFFLGAFKLAVGLVNIVDSRARKFLGLPAKRRTY